jgi:hypothetical protein
MKEPDLAAPSQTSDVGSIPIARSITPVDAVGFTGFDPRNWPIKCAILDAVGRGFASLIPVGRGLFSKSRGVSYLKALGNMGGWLFLVKAAENLAEVAAKSDVPS